MGVPPSLFPLTHPPPHAGRGQGPWSPYSVVVIALALDSFTDTGKLYLDCLPDVEAQEAQSLTLGWWLRPLFPPSIFCLLSVLLPPPNPASPVYVRF